MTPPHHHRLQVIPQSAFTDQDWEAAMESQPPQWGTPHPTHGYLDTMDRASPESCLRSSNMPQIDIDAHISPSLCTVTPQQSQQSQRQLTDMRTVHAQQMMGMEQAYMHMAQLQAPEVSSVRIKMTGIEQPLPTDPLLLLYRQCTASTRQHHVSIPSSLRHRRD